MYFSVLWDFSLQRTKSLNESIRITGRIISPTRELCIWNYFNGVRSVSRNACEEYKMYINLWVWNAEIEILLEFPLACGGSAFHLNDAISLERFCLTWPICGALLPLAITFSSAIIALTVHCITVMNTRHLTRHCFRIYRASKLKNIPFYFALSSPRRE